MTELSDELQLCILSAWFFFGLYYEPFMSISNQVLVNKGPMNIIQKKTVLLYFFTVPAKKLNKH